MPQDPVGEHVPMAVSHVPAFSAAGRVLWTKVRANTSGTRLDKYRAKEGRDALRT